MADYVGREARTQREAEERRRPGRPTKLTEQVQAKVVEAIRVGNFREVAADHAGIGRRTFFTWMKQGEEDPDSDHGRFRQAVLEAESHAEMVAVGFVRRAMASDWRAAAWYAERKHRDRWARPSAEGGTAMSPEEYRQEVSDFLDLSAHSVPVAPETDEGEAA